MAEDRAFHQMVTRRRLLGAAGVGALALSRPTWAQTMETIGYFAPEEAK
jgi:hypothetical protein